MTNKEIPASELAAKLGIPTEEAKRLKDSSNAFEGRQGETNNVCK